MPVPPPGLCPAKINLFLHVLGRRADGYHMLDSLAVFAGCADQVTAHPDPALSLALAGPFASLLAVEPDNLVLRAARALAAASGVAGTAALVLEKHLPVASGIGGGSADAAGALRVLAELWRVDLPEAALLDIAAGLGADVAVCLACQPARMSSVGEVLAPAPHLPRFGIALVNPGVGVATPAVFRARTGAFSQPAVLPAGWANAASMAADLAELDNDLQAPAIALCPVIGDVLAALAATEGCLLARMSGSGATCFGLFATPQAAAQAASAIGRPGWWAWGGAAFAAGRGFTEAGSAA